MTVEAYVEGGGGWGASVDETEGAGASLRTGPPKRLGLKTGAYPERVDREMTHEPGDEEQDSRSETGISPPPDVATPDAMGNREPNPERGDRGTNS